jgi:predicted esterase
MPVPLTLSATCVVLSLASAGCPRWWQSGGVIPTSPEAGSDSPVPTDAGSAEPVEPITEPVLPKVDGACPMMVSGVARLNDIPVNLWIKESPSGDTIPILIYWHGTGSSPSEAEQLLEDTFDELTSEGGVIIALGASTGAGVNTSTGTWSTGDFEVIDQAVACAVQQLPIDTRRIYTTGCSSGAVHAGVLAYERSGYIAAAALNSGGLVQKFPLQEPGHVPNVLTAHGASATDIVIINFAEASINYANQLAADGGFAVDCDHGGGHCAAPSELKRAMWQFLTDHPFGVDPEPYATGLPPSFPSYCRAVGN